MQKKIDPATITEEKSLWQIYVKSRVIKSSPLQYYIVCTAIFLLSINAFFLNQDVDEIATSVDEWASLGFRFSLITLGFLLSGFTVFATLTKPQMMLAMMAHTDAETGLPTLKKNFFIFMRVFIAYVFFLIVYLIVILFGSKGGLFDSLIITGFVSTQVANALIKGMYVLIGASLVYLLLLLKSYIYNIYAIVMNFLRWEHFKSGDS